MTEEPTPSRTPIDIRSTSLIVIAALLSLGALRLASAVVIPMLIGVLLYYALSPLVDGLHRSRVPRAIGAALVLGALVAGTGWTAWTLRDDADRLADTLPEVARRVRMVVERVGREPSTGLGTVQQVARELERASASAAPAPATPVPRVQVEQPLFDLRGYLMLGTVRIAEFAIQAVSVVVITFFLLASGDVFRRKLARIAGPTFARRKITVLALDEIAQQIQRYLMVQVVTSIAVGAATAVAYAALGLNHVAAWSVAAALLNLVPYVGSTLMVVGTAAAALQQFGSVEQALLFTAVALGLRIVTGFVLSPWLTARASRLNPVTVFMGVLFWGWLWGAWGLLLGTPVLMVVKAVCDRVDALRPLGELMGSDWAPPVGTAVAARRQRTTKEMP